MIILIKNTLKVYFYLNISYIFAMCVILLFFHS